MSYQPASAKRRYMVAVQGGSGPVIHRGSFDTLPAARKSATGWLRAYGKGGRYTISDEIGNVVARKERKA